MTVLLLSAGALSALYGSFVARAGSGTHFYMIWYLIAAAFAAAALLLRAGVHKKIPKPMKRAICCFFAVCLALLIVCEGAVVSGFDERGRPGLDYIIVLGAQVTSWGPGVALRYRLDEAAAYLKDNPDTVCICSGGQGRNEPESEAAVMKRYLEGLGIDGGRILEEGLSTDTSENIRNSMAFLPSPDAAVGIVTNDFHVFRGTCIARAMGLRNACGIAAPSNVFYLPQNMLREFFGILKDLAEGNLLQV